MVWKCVQPDTTVCLSWLGVSQTSSQWLRFLSKFIFLPNPLAAGSCITMYVQDFTFVFFATVGHLAHTYDQHVAHQDSR